MPWHIQHPKIYIPVSLDISQGSSEKGAREVYISYSDYLSVSPKLCKLGAKAEASFSPERPQEPTVDPSPKGRRGEMPAQKRAGWVCRGGELCLPLPFVCSALQQIPPCPPTLEEASTLLGPQVQM